MASLRSWLPPIERAARCLPDKLERRQQDQQAHQGRYGEQDRIAPGAMSPVHQDVPGVDAKPVYAQSGARERRIGNHGDSAWGFGQWRDKTIDLIIVFCRYGRQVKPSPGIKADPVPRIENTIIDANGRPPERQGLAHLISAGNNDTLLTSCGNMPRSVNNFVGGRN